LPLQTVRRRFNIIYASNCIALAL